MNKQIFTLLIAQFLSAFADNAVLFTVIAMVMHAHDLPAWYVPALQSAFLVAFVVLAPWVGGFADSHAKSRVLIIANLIKAVGAVLLLAKIEPLVAYCMIGIGAAIFAPGKYGILPELAGHEMLVKANSWIEGSSILAILLGMLVGARIADFSIQWALAGTVMLYIASALVTLFLPTGSLLSGLKERRGKNSLPSSIINFGRQMAQFFITPRSRFAMLGGSLFWAAAATLRVILVAWAPLVLMSKNAAEIAELTIFLAVGIIAGSAIVPGLIPLEHLRRACIPAYLMGLMIIGLSFTESIWPARVALFFIGMMGGMFIVPVNAALQEMGQKTIGSGKAVALQGFFQNLTMLMGVRGYTFAASQNADPVLAMHCLGLLVFIATVLVSLHLPDNQPNQV